MGLLNLKKSKKTEMEQIIVNQPGYESQTESYIRLKDNLLYLNVDGNNQVIQIESAVQGEGKSTVAANLAVTLAKNDKRVCVVEGDLRLPRCNRAFNLPLEKGISDYMLGKAELKDIIKKTEYNVDVITRGDVIDNPSYVVSTNRFKDMIETLRKEYDFILVDCPPVNVVSDFIHISSITDSVLFCIAYGRTKKNQVKEALKSLSNHNVNLIGTVFTFVNNGVHKGNYYGTYTNKYYSYSEKKED